MMDLTRNWALHLDQGVTKGDVFQRYAYRLVSLASHVPGFESISSIAHAANALSAAATVKVLSNNALQYRNIKKTDLALKKVKKRKIANNLLTTFHVGRVVVLTWGIVALTSAAVSCVSSFFLFSMAMHSTITSALAWRSAKRKADPINLIKDRDTKVASITEALSNPDLSFSAAQKIKLENDQIRLSNQSQAIKAVLSGTANTASQNLANYLFYKQREKVKVARKNTFIGVVSAISAISLGMAFFFPPVAATLAIVGSLGYALAAVYRMTSHHNQTGYNFFCCFKSQNQRRYERVMRHCVEVTYKDDAGIQRLVADLERADQSKDKKQKQAASKALQTAVEHKMVREHLKFDAQADVTQFLSNNDIRKIVSLECESRHTAARYYLNQEKGAPRSAMVMAHAHRLTQPNSRMIDPAMAA